MSLKYIGKGASIPPVPARDLTDDEVKRFGRGWLLATGLYAEPPKKKPAKKPGKDQGSL